MNLQASQCGRITDSLQNLLSLFAHLRQVNSTESVTIRPQNSSLAQYQKNLKPQPQINNQSSKDEQKSS